LIDRDGERLFLEVVLDMRHMVDMVLDY